MKIVRALFVVVLLGAILAGLSGKFDDNYINPPVPHLPLPAPISVAIPAPPAPTHEQHVRQLIRQMTDDFALVIVDRKKEPSVGSGVLVRSNGKLFVWTCAHVLLTERSLVFDPTNVRLIVNIHGTNYPAIVRGCGNCEPDSTDVAISEVITPPENSGSAVFDISVPQTGDPVYHLGAAFGYAFPPSFFSGQVSAPRRKFHGIPETDQLDCTAYFGCSGGGVFSDSGKCQGLMELQPAPSITLEIPARSLYQWAVVNGFEAAFPHE